MFSVLAAHLFDRSCEIFNHAVVDEYHAVWTCSTCFVFLVDGMLRPNAGDE